jgi:hypothetical protein
MRKSLQLFAVAALSIGTAFADEPLVFQNEALFRLSPNGEWGVSCGDGQFIVHNFKTGKKYTSEVDETAEGYEYDGYLNAGFGNSVSNDGYVTGTTTYTGGAGVWMPEGEGKWIMLPTIGSSNNAHGITPDGSRIVGYSSVGQSNYYEMAIYSVPILWTRNSEGGYDLNILPYPTKDIFGRTPQYVIAHSISSDGKTITGQMTDYSGFYHTPVVFREQADGSWTCDFVNAELQTHGIEFPAWEEWNGELPVEDDFMTDQEYDNYYAAYTLWANNGYVGSEPVATDYMTSAEIASYNKALQDYADAYEAYSQRVSAFNEAMSQAKALGLPDFEMNTVAMSLNGKYYAAPSTQGSFYDEYNSTSTSVYTPYLFDLETGEYIEFKDNNNSVSYVSNSGEVFGARALFDGVTRMGFARAAGADKFVPFYEYLATRDKSVATWVEENTDMAYVESVNSEVDDDDENYLQWAEDVLSGLPVGNEDASVIAAWVYDYFDDDVPYYTYVFQMSDRTNGVASTLADKSFGVKVNANGEIAVTGNAASIEVYNLQGAKVYSNNAPTATVQTELGAGFYVVKATSVDGKKSIVKAVISTK